MKHDFDRVLKVSDLPGGVREACIERGMKDYQETTPRRAIGEWTAWELGSSSWGLTAYEYILEMTTTT